MRRMVVLGGIVMAGALTVGLRAQQPAPAEPKAADIEKVRDNLYIITPKGAAGAVPGAAGGGGNTAVFITATGVVLVDTKYPDWGPVILDKVKSVTNKPVTHIINTHTHGDHVGSNDFFPANVEIVVQENTAANMVKMDNFKDPAKKHGLADRTYKDKLTLLSGKESIDLHVTRPRAHEWRHVRRVPRPARDARRGCLSAQRDAAHRPEQRRQRCGLSGHDPQGGGGHQERGHGDHRSQHDDEVGRSHRVR